MRMRRKERLLVTACLAAIVALGLMVWSVLDPRPAPVMIAMSVGQGVGTLSLLIFVFVVAIDLRRVRALRDDSIPPPMRDTPAKPLSPEPPREAAAKEEPAKPAAPKEDPPKAGAP